VAFLPLFSILWLIVTWTCILLWKGKYTTFNIL